MFKKPRIWAGLTTLFTSVTAFCLVGGVVANNYGSQINTQLHITTTKLVETSAASSVDTLYYKSSFGDGTFSEANQKSLREATIQQAVSEMEEGAVLLYNKDNALPLKSTERSTSVFGHASYDPCYKAHSAGNVPTNTSLDVVTLKAALEKEGFSVNGDLWNAIAAGTAARGVMTQSWGGMSMAATGSGKGNEEKLAFYQAQSGTWAATYKDVAIVTIAREGAEGTDMIMDDVDDDGTTKISSLALHQNEKDMLNYVHSQFSKVIVLLNSPYQLEVEEIKPYANAILAIGEPGLVGFTGVAKILTGEVNPSGHLVDTYAESSLSAPSCVNSGTRTPTYSNAAAIDTAIGADENADWCSFQAEGIYVGYKYYETRYEDCVLNRGNANGAAGIYGGETAWNYGAEVSYPFGYGLSYTSFSKTLDSVNVGSDTITANVTVKNTGSVAGKAVVEIYAQTPYGDYEKNNLVEKSAIQLAGFAKTKELAANASETVSISIDKYLLASYDYIGAKGYILSGGDYYLALGEDAHDALNNILAKKGASGLIDQEGANVSADASKVYTFSQSLDTNTYKKSSSGVVVTNQFEDCDLNYWLAGKGKYLSRNNWQGTYPTAQTIVEANEAMIKVLGADLYTKPADAAKASATTLGDKKGITLAAMREVDYNDILWETFIKQMSLTELGVATAESFTNNGCDTISQPSFPVGDGMDSVGGTFTYKTSDGTKIPSMTYCCKVVLTQTWNSDLFRSRGEMMGEEAMFCGMMENYNIGADLHRTPFGGRNFEYMSEDSLMSYLAAIPEVEGMESKGTHAAPKHFVGNDQEYHREGTCTFFNEQAFREGNLRAFEGSIRVAKAGALMGSFERLGCEFTSSKKALNTTVLRNEWGFTGNVVTDAIASATAGYKSHYADMLAAGSQQFCLDFTQTGGTVLAKAVTDNDDGYLLSLMIQAAKDWEYAICHTVVINGLSSTTRTESITPWWQSTITGISWGFGVLAAASLAALIYSVIRKTKEGAIA